MDSINFTANHIKNVDIARKYYGKYKPCKVSLVEFDPINKNDVNAIYKTTDNWDASFTAFTYDDMRNVNENKELMSNLHVYALTTQNSNFQRMVSSKILGVVEVVNTYSKGNKIEVLQTNPDMIKDSFNKSPRYKHIGQALVSFVKEKFSDKPLFLHPTKTAVSFYKKLGFEFDSKIEKNNTMCIYPKS